MDNFQTWLIERQSVVDNLGSLKMNHRDFSHLFGDKSRIVIPLEKEEESNLAKKLNNFGYEPNFQTGMATTEIKTQQGTKQRSEKIGSLLAKLDKKLPNQGYKEILHWWEKSRSHVQNPTSGVSIIISRNPIDIVRMSDHDEWKSCHSQGGSYFKCAVQEAKTGGGIAYIVRNNDVQKIEDLQAQDIFQDDDRGIPGIQPLERLRLRKFSDGKTDLLVPEIRTYGTKHVGFLETVLRWARNAQNLNKDEPPNFDDFELHGGSYQDNDADDLWNQLFDTDDAYGGKDSVDGDAENETSADEMEEQAAAQKADHPYKHVQVYYDVSYDDGAYLYYSADLSFKFVRSQFIQMPTDSSLQAWGQHDTLGKEIKRIISYVNIEQIDLNLEDKNFVEFRLSFSSDSGGDNDGFEHFLDDLDKVDKEYEEDTESIYEALIEYGYIANPHEYLNDKFANFQLDFNSLVSKPIWVGDLLNVNMNDVIFTRNKNSAAKNDYANTTLTFKTHSELQHPGLIFPNFISPHTIHWTISNNLIDNDWPLNRQSGGSWLNNDTINTPIKVFIHLDIPVSNNSEKQLKIIDTNWTYFEKRAAHFWNTIAKPKLTNTNGINKFPKIKIPKPVNTQQELPMEQLDFKEFFEYGNLGV